MAVKQLTEDDVLAVLSTVKDPELHRGMVELKMIRDLRIVDPQTIGLTVVLTTPACPLKNKIHDDIDAALATLPGSPRAQIKWDAQFPRAGRPVPGQRYGFRLVAVGCVTAADKRATWRGPMRSGTRKQCLFAVNWGALDSPVFGLPPGTGAVQLTPSQSIPTTGAVVV